MPWKQRGNNHYYYRSVRDGGRVRSEYCGPANSERAALFADLDQLDREMRKHKAMVQQTERAQFAELASTPPELIMLLVRARAAVADALIDAGYHQHKRGEWRKQRAKKET